MVSATTSLVKNGMAQLRRVLWKQHAQHQHCMCQRLGSLQHGRAENVHAGWMQEVLGQPLAAGRRQALKELGLAAALQQVRMMLHTQILVGCRVWGAALQQMRTTVDARATWTAPAHVQRAGAAWS